MSNPIRRGAVALAALVALFVSSACAVGPNYLRPDAPVSPAFKEAPPAGWKDAQPNDGVPRGKWWTIYADPRLDALEDQVSISNQNVVAAEAQFRAAVAAVRVTRAGLFPTVNVSATAAGSGGAGASGPSRLYTLPVDVGYEADVWGSIRHRAGLGG